MIAVGCRFRMRKTLSEWEITETQSLMVFRHLPDLLCVPEGQFVSSGKAARGDPPGPTPSTTSARTASARSCDNLMFVAGTVPASAGTALWIFSL